MNVTLPFHSVKEGNCGRNNNVIAINIHGWGSIFFTGADRELPLGFSKQPELTFLHTGILATASTCEVTLRIPTIYQTIT